MRPRPKDFTSKAKDLIAKVKDLIGKVKDLIAEAKAKATASVLEDSRGQGGLVLEDTSLLTYLLTVCQVLLYSQNQIMTLLMNASHDVMMWLCKVRKMKAVFHHLNMFYIDVNCNLYIGEYWVPTKYLDEVTDIIKSTAVSHVDLVLAEISTSSALKWCANCHKGAGPLVSTQSPCTLLQHLIEHCIQTACLCFRTFL